MKAYNPKDWWSLIFDFHQSYSFKMLFPAICALGAYTGLLCYLDLELKLFQLKSTTVLHSLLGFVISMLLVFRTNTAYDRWWEGRKLWGDLVNNSRNFMLKLSSLIPSEHLTDRARINSLVINYVFALKHHLRDETNFSQFRPVVGLNLDSLSLAKHIPNKIAQLIYNALSELKNKAILSDTQLLFLNEEVRSFTNIVGACERIRSTPIPYSYSMFIKKFIFLYTVTLPLGLVEDFRWVTIPMVIFVFYAFASLELIAEEIEDPFGNEENDLPTDDIALKIQENLLEIAA